MGRCSDGSLYTGITTELVRRFAEHEGKGKVGAKYTASHRPQCYLAAWASLDRANASRLEYRIKQLSRTEKERLISGENVPKLNMSEYVKININEKGEIAMLYVCYPKCTTCQKAKAFLDEKGVSYDLRDIKTDNPSEPELRLWHQKSGLPLKRFFNTSGLQYKALQLKDKLSTMTEDEQFALLSGDGMLVKRPILIGDDFVLVGFKQPEWEEKLL